MWYVMSKPQQQSKSPTDSHRPSQIPKPNETEGLGVGWPAEPTNMDKLKALHEQLKSKM